jgi:hypothetical protein
MPKPEPSLLPDQILDGSMSAAVIIEALENLRFPTVRRHRSSRTVSTTIRAHTSSPPFAPVPVGRNAARPKR